MAAALLEMSMTNFQNAVSATSVLNAKQVVCVNKNSLICVLTKKQVFFGKKNSVFKTQFSGNSMEEINKILPRKTL